MQISKSVGIIGGADGPTAILIAGAPSAKQIIAGILAGVLLIGFGIWVDKKFRK